MKSLFISAQVQPKPGVISSVGGVTLGKGGMKIQVLGPALSQMPAPQPPAPVQTQVKDGYVVLKYFKFLCIEQVLIAAFPVSSRHRQRR